MQRLAALQVKQVFFLPGGGAMHLNDALAIRPELEPVLCLHEQACAIAAEAAAKLSGGPSACLVTSGPGATNAITGTLGAWLDSTPVFFLSGQVKSSDLKGDSGLRMLGVQEADIVSMVSSITKMAVTLTEPEQVAAVFDQLEHAALSGRRGPVWLDVPLDVQSVQVEPEQLARWQPPAPEEAPDLAAAASQALQLLARAERPVIIAGHGIRMAGAADAFRELYQTLQVPVLTTWLGMDLIEDDHPLYAGRPGSIAPRWANFALQNADFVLVLGARLDMAMTAYAHSRFARGAVKVVVDIDPAEIDKLQMEIALPLAADAGDFIRELQRRQDGGASGKWQVWLARIAGWKASYPLLLPEHYRAEGPLSLYRFSDVLSERMDGRDVIAPASSGFAAELFLLALRLKDGQRCFHNRGTGSMGFGLPAAVGACLASGRRRTICVEGDGGLQMNVQELATLASQKLPVKLFIINNSGYASIRTSQQNYFQRQLGADARSGLQLPDLASLARAYGLPYVAIRNEDELHYGLSAVLDCDGPVLCDVSILPEEPRVPRVASRVAENGKIVSSPLEDLFPFLPREELQSNMHIPLLEESLGNG
ncbi:thiamine pyrophosphate-binding protein [Chromobacterium sphagni]|uniref:Thiamine pyrophosphate-binding protein n=2 Tax=Chromobacterium sphagni TaxID=1903179 RepID=A0A1S1X5Y0_9NEIS|nr:thiamine pyrophosphate-binding protein [Chromobacterium sphagni]OHX17674.1 thiamine pyrophosphate-binding protein [Chromobacterium sphagni]